MFFTLPVGEAPLTLHDVAVLLWLHIASRAVVSPVLNDVQATCQKLLSLTTDDHALTGTDLRLWWFRENLGCWPTANVSEDVVLQIWQAYILAFLGIVLFADKSSNEVWLSLLTLLRGFDEARSFSWGIINLACLYRKLCLAISPGSNEIACAWFFYK